MKKAPTCLPCSPLLAIGPLHALLAFAPHAVCQRSSAAAPLQPATMSSASEASMQKELREVLYWHRQEKAAERLDRFEALDRRRKKPRTTPGTSGTAVQLQQDFLILFVLVLRSLVQQQDSDDETAAPEAAVCKSKSGGIVDTLDGHGLLDKATAFQPVPSTPAGPPQVQTPFGKVWMPVVKQEQVVVPEVQTVQTHNLRHKVPQMVQKHIETLHQQILDLEAVLTDETNVANKDMDTAMEGLAERRELQDVKEDCRNTVMLHWTNTRFQEGLTQRSEAKAVAEVAKRIAMGAIFKSSGCAGSNYALLAASSEPVATAALVRLGTQLTDAHLADSESGLSDRAESALPSSVVDEVTESDADEAMYDEELLEPQQRLDLVQADLLMASHAKFRATNPQFFPRPRWWTCTRCDEPNSGGREQCNSCQFSRAEMEAEAEAEASAAGGGGRGSCS